MPNLEKLNNKIYESGLRKGFIADKLNITRSGLWCKMNGRVQFSVDDIVKLSEILHLTRDERDDIFLS